MIVCANSRAAPRTPSGEASRLFSTLQSRTPASRTPLPSRLRLRSRDRYPFSRFLSPSQSLRDFVQLSCLCTPHFSPLTASSSFPRFDFAPLGSLSFLSRTSPPSHPTSPYVPSPNASSRFRAPPMHLSLYSVPARTRITAPPSPEASSLPRLAASSPSPTPLKLSPTHLSSSGLPIVPHPRFRTISTYLPRIFLSPSSTPRLTSSSRLRTSSPLSPSPFGVSKVPRLSLRLLSTSLESSPPTLSPSSPHSSHD